MNAIFGMLTSLPRKANVILTKVILSTFATIPSELGEAGVLFLKQIHFVVLN